MQKICKLLLIKYSKHLFTNFLLKTTVNIEVLMKIYSIGYNTPAFCGQRKDRKNVEQLKRNNPYNLNAINQRNITKSIENLAEQPGAKNVNFLLGVSQNLKYGTNIDLGKEPNHDWQHKLHEAAKKSIELSPLSIQPELYAKLNQIKTAPKDLSKTELEILDLRDKILAQVDSESLKRIKNKNIKNLQNNLDYLITSSEISTAQKIYLLKKLNFMMSPKYKINPQLEDKKTQVLAELVNDMVITTPESIIPNIKLVNQRSTGMCAAISICRKALAYEDKTNYIDMILSELDNQDYMKIYDISKLGSKTKVPITKPYIDYEYAMQKGYRILDAAALNWMQVADTTGKTNEATSQYIAFDKKYFDTFTDIHIISDINDEIAPEQDYYRALLKSKSALESCKKDAILKRYNHSQRKGEYSSKLKTIQQSSKLLDKLLAELMPESSFETRHNIAQTLISLNASSSSDISKSNAPYQEFMFIPNEPQEIKLKKTKAFLSKNIKNISNNDIDKKAEELLNLSTEIKQLTEEKRPSGVAKQITRAKKLYRAATAYRIQYDFKLENPFRINEMSRKLNIPDRETLIFQNLDNLINKIDKGKLNPVVAKTLCERFQIENNNTEILKEALIYNKNSLKETMTDSLDNLYQACLIQGRKASFINKLTAIRDVLNENNSKEALENISKDMKLPIDKRKVLKTIDDYIKTLSSDTCTEEEFIDIYNKMGCKNQTLEFKNVLDEIYNLLNNNESSENATVIAGFNLINELPEDAPIEQTREKFKQIVDEFNKIVLLTKTFQDMLEVQDSDGTILNTATPKNVIMKKLEAENEIFSAKDLRIFQEKFAKIDNAKLNPDGTSKYYKDLPSDLTNFSKQEKEILKRIEQNINSWYSKTTRNIDTQYKDIKSPLEDYYRQLGLKTGSHWLSDEGKSGLSSRQEVKLFESMTDRPYYIEKDGKTAIEKILQSAYSGVSSTSMQSDEQAMHAQYIADIRPVKTAKNETEEQYVLFHDNSWGPIENENIWLDENGYTRTDYNQDSGGDTGYIVDKDYRTGKHLEELFNSIGQTKKNNIGNKQYKKLVQDEEEYKFKMLEDIITPGEFPNSRAIVSQIKQNTMRSADAFLDDLQDYAKTMTRDEILQKIKNYELIGNKTNEEYEKIEKQIFGNEVFNKGIQTKEDFDKLPSDNNIKLLFEKIALLNSYHSIPEIKLIYAEEATPKNLEKTQKIIRKEARKNFDYSFGKSTNIAKGGIEVSHNEIMDLLYEYQKDTHLKLTKAQQLVLIKSLSKIDKSKFNGSLDTTIDLMVENFKETLSETTLNHENKEQKIEQLGQKIRSVLQKNMYLSIKDLKSKNFQLDNMPAIEKWIEDTFDPVDDKEFVKVYNKLMNMTTEEFNQKYDSLITDEVLGIKPVTGFDMLKKFRALDSNIQNSVYNLLYSHELYSSIEFGKTKPSYNYSKFSRIMNGSIYTNKKSFDDLYLEYNNAMLSLTFEKMYGKVKHDAYKKYGVFPSYPKVETEDPKEITGMINELYEDIYESIETIHDVKEVMTEIEKIKKLQKYIQKIDDDKLLTKAQYNKINTYASKFYEKYKDDKTIQEATNAALEITKLNQNITAKKYKDLINLMFSKLTPVGTRPDGSPLSDSIKENVREIKELRQNFITRMFDLQHRNNANMLLNKWIQAEIKQLPDAPKYYANFHMYFDKHRMTLNPTKLLNEYLLLLAQPQKINGKDIELTEEQKKEIEDIQTVYKENITSLLYSANIVELQDILMSCAKQGNLNVIAKELKDTKILLKTGNMVDLYSKAGLSILIKDLIASEEIETALLFIDQLGMNELAVELFSESINFDNAKKIVKRTYNIFEAVEKQTKTIQKELDKLSDIDNDPNYKERILQAKENIIKRCRNTNFKITIPIIEAGFKALLETIEASPEISKYELLKENFDYVKAGSIALAKRSTVGLNAKLATIDLYHKLLCEIKLPYGSKAKKYREKFMNKYNDLESFTKQINCTFESIDISLGEKNNQQ